MGARQTGAEPSVVAWERAWAVGAASGLAASESAARPAAVEARSPEMDVTTD